MKKILLTISALLAFCTAFSQGQSLWLGDANVKKGVIKDLGDGSQAVAAFRYLGKNGLCLIDMTLSSYTPSYTATGTMLDQGQYIYDISVSDEEIFFCGFDSVNDCGYIGHTTESDIVSIQPYNYLDILNVGHLDQLVAYKDPVQPNIYNIISYGSDRSGQICYIVKANYNSVGSYFNVTDSLYFDSIQYLFGVNLLTTDDFVVFIYRDFINNYDYYIARCPKAYPLANIDIHRITGSNILDRQNISATSLDHNNIAISYYTSNDIYPDQIDIHCIDVSTMVDYNHQAFPVIEKCAAPQMTYLSSNNSVVMMLEIIYPDNPPAPSNVLYGYPSFVYIDLNQSSSYVTYWIYSDKQYRFSGLTNFSGKWFMGTTYADHWYLERYTTPPPSAPLYSCFYNSNVKVSIPRDVHISPHRPDHGEPYIGNTNYYVAPLNPSMFDGCIHP